MSSAPAWPVRVAAVGPVAVGSLLWRHLGQLILTVLVKAAFAMVADAALALAEPEPIAVADMHEHDNPARSLRAVREVAPQLGQVDIVLYGHAYAPAVPSQAPSTMRSTARLAIIRDDQALVAKRLLVVGDRQRGAEPAPFERIPLGYERALGGLDFPANPLGVGAGASTQTEPNFLDVFDPAGRVACFGPIPPTFPERKRLLGGGSRRALEQPIVEIPSTLDWSYFQCAPADQRVDQLRGDEWIELEGLTPALRLRTRLPGACGVSHIYGQRSGALTPDWIPLRPDLVQIFADRQRCSIVWRGSIPLADEQTAREMCVAGALELPGQPVRWPASLAELDVAHGAAEVAPQLAAGGDRTVALNGFFAQAREGAGQRLAAGDATAMLDGSAPRTPPLPWKTRPAGEPAEPAGGSRNGSAEAPKAIPGAPWSTEPDARVIAPSGPGAQTAPIGPSREELERAAEAEAEARRQAEAEAEARRQAEAAAEARRQAEAEAEARRQAEAERFAAEQKKARAEEARRAEERQAQATEDARQLLEGLYGGFKDKH